MSVSEPGHERAAVKGFDILSRPIVCQDYHCGKPKLIVRQIGTNGTNCRSCVSSDQPYIVIGYY